MKYLPFIIATVIVTSCTHTASDSKLTTNAPTPVLEVDSAHSKFIISMLNLGDFQAQLAKTMIFKSHDQKMIEMARFIQKNNLRIKDKAKVTAIPRNVETPYFLTSEQNMVVKDLKDTPDSLIVKKFYYLIRKNQQEMKTLCEKENLSARSGMEDLQQLCDFSKTTNEQIDELMSQTLSARL